MVKLKSPCAHWNEGDGTGWATREESEKKKDRESTFRRNRKMKSGNSDTGTLLDESQSTKCKINYKEAGGTAIKS